MKKALDLFVFYLAVLIIGVLSVTFVYIFYYHILNYIALKDIQLFTYNSLHRSLIYVSFCILFVAGPIVCYYRIRHPFGIPQSIAYIILMFITWFILFPATTSLEEKLSPKLNRETEIDGEQSLTPGVFRKVDKNVYYFTQEFESIDNNVPSSSAIIINTNENGKVEYQTVRDIDSLDFKRKAKPYKEIDVKKSFDKNTITLPVDFHNLILKLQNANILSALHGDFYYIIYFLSFILVLSCVYCVTSFFNWKLLNSVLIFFVSMGILCVNSVEVLPVVTNIENYLLETSLFEFLSKHIYELFLSVLNILFSLIFITIGIIKYVLHHHIKKR